MTTRSVWIMLVLVSAAACGGGSDDPTGPPTGNNNTPPPPGGVAVTNNAFNPSATTITAGSTVVWAWSTCSGGGGYDNETCVAHGVNFEDGTNSPTQETGSYSRTFSTAGTYPYRCAVHGAAMSGTVIVQ